MSFFDEVQQTISVYLTENTGSNQEVELFKLAGNENPLGTISGYNIITESTLTISLNSPRKAAFCPVNKSFYIVGNTGGIVSVVDTVTGTLSSTISVGTTPIGITYNSSDNTMYVANSGSNNVSVIDCDTDTVTDTISVSASPRYLAYTPSNRMYVTCLTGNSIDVINCNDNTIEDTISVTSPNGIAYCSTNQTMYFSNNTFDLSSLTISNNTVVQTETFAGALTQVFFNQANNSVYVFREDRIYVVSCSSNTLIATITGLTPNDAVINTIGNDLYVSDAVNTAVHVIDCNTNTIVDEANDSASYRSVMYQPFTNKVYAGYSTNKLDILIPEITVSDDNDPNYADVTTEINDGRYILDSVYIQADGIDQINSPFIIYNRQPSGFLCTDIKQPVLAPYDKQFVISKVCLRYVPETQRKLTYQLLANQSVKLIFTYAKMKYREIEEVVDSEELKPKKPVKRVVSNPIMNLFESTQKVKEIKQEASEKTCAIKKEIMDIRKQYCDVPLSELHSYFTGTDFREL